MEDKKKLTAFEKREINKQKSKEYYYKNWRKIREVNRQKRMNEYVKPIKTKDAATQTNKNDFKKLRKLNMLNDYNSFTMVKGDG
jgi:hypothetical protein